MCAPDPFEGGEYLVYVSTVSINEIGNFFSFQFFKCKTVTWNIIFCPS